MRLEAINNYVTVEPVEPKEAGFIKPDTAQKTIRWAKILSTGPGMTDLHGTVIEPDCKPGDLAYVMAHGKHAIDLTYFGAKEGFVCSMLDVLCTIDLETMKIKPLGSYVQIEKMESPKESAGGMLLPDSKRTPPNLGKVVTLGTGWKTIDGTTVPFHVAEDDMIAYDPFKVMIVDLEHLGINETYHIIQHANIIAKVIEEKE